MGTPAYDLTFTVNLEGVFYENRHSMTVGGKDEEFSVEDLLVTSFKLHETKRHDFQLSAEINGVFYTYMARRKSSLAHEIIERGRAKMSEENIKKIIEEYFVPLVNKNVND